MNHGFLIQEGESPYEVIYNEDVFKTVNGKTTSTPKDDFELKVIGNKLAFMPKTGLPLTQFAIRPIDSNIRPGDDFLLRFGKRDSLNITGTAKAKDFIAVYDEKMLWRANLYIDETDDWNDKYTWECTISFR